MQCNIQRLLTTWETEGTDTKRIKIIDILVSHDCDKHPWEGSNEFTVGFCFPFNVLALKNVYTTWHWYKSWKFYFGYIRFKNSYTRIIPYGIFYLFSKLIWKEQPQLKKSIQHSNIWILCAPYTHKCNKKKDKASALWCV